MYPKKETAHSYSYLEKVVSVLQEPVCLIGGWAVYFTVNQTYKANVGKDYIGSRDIDLGFHIDEEQDFGNSAFAKTIKKLEEEGFKEVGGRLVKNLDYDTGKEMESEEAKAKPMSDLHQIYVDLLIDQKPKSKTWENMELVFDEELLSYVFDDEKHREELDQFHKKLWVPQPWLLLAMKVKALPRRQKDHKRQKDIADIAAILLFRSQPDYGIRLLRVAHKENILDSLNSITPKEITDTEKLIGVANNSFKTTLANTIRQIEASDYGMFEEVEEFEKDIRNAIETGNNRKLETILESISDKSHSTPLFFNLNFRKTIFGILDHPRLSKSRITALLIKIIYDQRAFKRTKQELTDYGIKLQQWIEGGLDPVSEALGLELLLIGGSIIEFTVLIKSRTWEHLEIVLNHLNVHEIKTELDKEILKNLKEWISTELDKDMDDNYAKRFHKLYKIVRK